MRFSARTARASRRSSRSWPACTARRGRRARHGAPVPFDGPAGARDAGIAVIYQEPILFPDLTVAENIFIGRQPLRAAGASTAAAMRTRADGALRAPRRPARSGPHRARALDRRPADRRDRQGAVARRAGHRHGRADRGALRASRSSGSSTSSSALRAEGAAVLFISPPPRRGLRPVSARHGLARRPLGRAHRRRRGPDRRRPRARDGRPRAPARCSRSAETGRRPCLQVERLTREGVSSTSRSRCEPARSSRSPGSSARPERGRLRDLRHRPLRRRLGDDRREALRQRRRRRRDGGRDRPRPRGPAPAGPGDGMSIARNVALASLRRLASSRV